MMGRVGGAKAPYEKEYLFAAMKRYAVEKSTRANYGLAAAVESHVSQRRRDVGHPTFV